jgi:acetate CoA/acetoacetate CoA-transferase beta subunit
MNNREFITRRIAREFKDGDAVNLGIGMPTECASYIPPGIHIMLQSENGILGVGPRPQPGQADPDVGDAGGGPVTVIPGAMFFDSATSFAMIRGGHISLTVLGALEVDEQGNLASWMIPGKKVTGMGGAMDLVVGARKVIIAMEHCCKDGSPKILKHCSLPLTAVHVVDQIVTEIGVMDVVPGQGIILREIAPDLTPADVQRCTEARLVIDPDLKIMSVDS